MTDLEIPYPGERGRRYRLFEILPAVLSWTTVMLPALLALVNPVWAAYFIIGFILVWFCKAMAMAFRVSQGYRRLQKAMKVDWRKLLDDVDDADSGLARLARSRDRNWSGHYRNLLRYRAADQPPLKSGEVVHAVIVALYKEGREVIEPTIQAIINSKMDHKKQTILLIAYEERAGQEARDIATDLARQYGRDFLHAEAIGHPNDLPGEVRGKGGNITWTGRKLKTYLEEAKIDPERVLVTTLDSDNRPHPQYFQALSYAFLVTDKRQRKSYQPIPMFLNNIWDAPAAMRVIATGNSFWNIVLSMRPHLIRNFSSHAQPMAALIETDFWSVRTIVEDGHQFWRSYIRYEGDYDVVPLYLPIYQDAVLSDTYLKTFKAQFIQVRRWAWGASDIAYLAEKGFFSPNGIPRADLWGKFARLMESHWSWATASLILAFAAWMPILLAPDSEAVVVHNLPVIVSRVQTVAMIGILVNMFLSLRMLPPKPARYKQGRRFWLFVQWLWLPVTTVVYSSCAALYSQTRLALGWYLTKFDLTEKHVRGYAELPGQKKD